MYRYYDGINQSDNASQVEVWSDLNSAYDALLKTRSTSDQLGRVVKTESSEDGASYTIFANTVYQQMGKITIATNPMRAQSASTDGWTRATKDELGRVITVESFSGVYPSGTSTGVVSTSYNAEQTTVTDQAGKVRRSLVDRLGRLSRVDEPDSNNYLGATTSPVQPTSYSYDSLGNLTQVSQGSQTRSFFYDSLSRLRQANNPESGMINYTYDDDGNPKSKTDARGVVTTYVYDGLNRVTNRTYSGPAPGGTTPAVTYLYDTLGSALNGKGRLTSVSSSVSNYSYGSYDVMGRPLTGTQTTDGNNYSMSYQYNLAGGLTSETYPSGRVVLTEYDSAARIAGVKNQATGLYYAGATSSDTVNRMQYAAHGAVSVMKLGNGKWEHTNFNSRLQPTQIGLGSSSVDSSLLQLDYGYGTANNNGNVLSQTITIGSTVMSQSYSYDSLNRLSSATETSAWSQTYDYDRYGNRAVRNTSYMPQPQLTPQSAFAGDMSAFSATNNRLVASQYDAAGNQTVDAQSRTFTYDAENRQLTFNGTAGQYFYDGDGHRVKKIDGSGTTIFVYNVSGQLTAEYHSDPVPSPAGGGGTSYLTNDHLGSTRVVTKSDGSVKARYDYIPFGEELGAGIGQRTTGMGYNAADSTKQKFTQKERDNESGLDYFLARYYSSAQGRFTSPDEFIGGPDELFDFSGAASSNPTFYADLTDPQSLNKYQYCYNNPLLYIDPDGHQGIKKWIQDTLRSAAATFNADNGLPAPSGDQTTTGRVIGHGAAILQGVTEVVTGGNMIAGGSTEAVVTSPAATTVVGAVVPAGGVVVAVGGAALVVHGGAVLINTAKNIVNEKSSTGPSAENSPGVSSSGQATDQHGNKLGPSGKPMVNKTRSTTREAARSKALNEGSRVVEHRNPKRGERHFHPADAAGKKKPSSTHHDY